MIQNFTLYICGRDSVPNFHKHGITHLVSISDPDDKTPYIGHWPIKPKVYRFFFRDTHTATLDNAPCTRDVEFLITIGKSIQGALARGEKVNLLAHCFAGVSRSTAAAYIILNTMVGPGHEQQCLQYVYNCRPIMSPNKLMVEIADKILDRKEAMCRPVWRYIDPMIISNE